jgi:hypothetical protein
VSNHIVQLAEKQLAVYMLQPTGVHLSKASTDACVSKLAYALSDTPFPPIHTHYPVFLHTRTDTQPTCGPPAPRQH